MSPLVIDASIAIKWVIEEEGTAEALLLRNKARLRAPDLLAAECANILWKKAQRKELSAEEAVIFWPIYSEYEKELAALGSKRVEGIKDYAANYLTLTDQKADELANGRLALESQLVELKKKYYQRFKAALSAKMAAKFLQIENQLLSILDLQIASSLPIVE